MGVTGHRLTAVPVLSCEEVEVRGGRAVVVPDRLPELPVQEAVRTFTMPVHLDWSRSDRTVDLADHGQRARAYEIVLREGTPADIEGMVDGALLVDLWSELVLPKRIRTAWRPLIGAVRASHD